MRIVWHGAAWHRNATQRNAYGNASAVWMNLKKYLFSPLGMLSERAMYFASAWDVNKYISIAVSQIITKFGECVRQ